MESLGPTDPPAIGGYRLLARLGEGGMGEVYLSRTPSGRPLALKRVHPELSQDTAFAERFAREIRNSDRVRSPWTAAVVDFSPPGQQPQWLATEYVAAPSLGDWVRRHGPLPAPAVLALADELSAALQAVHEAGIVHRDIKPSNVLLAPHRPFLIDFGIARAARDARHTQTGAVIGSPGYMSPEQATAGETGEPGDVFSFAAVLVHAATGRDPFRGPDEALSVPALLYRIVHDEPVLDGVPQALVPLVRACLSKDPAERPTAAAARTRLGLIGGRGGDWQRMAPASLAADAAQREAAVNGLLAAVPALSHPTPMPLQAPLPTSAPMPVTPIAPVAPVMQPPAVVPPPPPFGSPPPRPRARIRPGWVIAAVLAAVVLTSAGVLLLNALSDAKKQAGTSAASSRPPSSPSAALPASWVGTWTGTGPGTPNADGITQARTRDFSVTLTLHPAARGELAGKQVSNLTEVGTGRNLGCTEALELRQVNGRSMVFAAVTTHPTDRSAPITCPQGNIYVVTMTAPDRLSLESEGAQSAGAPSTLTRMS